MEKQKKSRSAYMVQYTKDTYKKYEVKFNKETEKKLIKYLEKQPNKNQYIKELIIEDMEK